MIQLDEISRNWEPNPVRPMFLINSGSGHKDGCVKELCKCESRDHCDAPRVPQMPRNEERKQERGRNKIL